MAEVAHETPYEDSTVADFLRILEEHRRACERDGKYVEAEIAKNRLEELRTHEEMRRREVLRARQHAERVGVEEAHEIEYQQVCALWDRKMEEYEANALALQHQLMARHEKEAGDARERFQNDPARRPKFSRELLNLRRIEATLAKSQEYAEAHKVKQKADNMELWELEKMKGEISNKWNSLDYKLSVQHENEVKALAQRIQAGREMQNKQREKDLKRLLLRFKNLKSDLLANQAVERQKLERVLIANRRAIGTTTGNVGANVSTIESPRRTNNNNNNSQLEKTYGSPVAIIPKDKRAGPGTKPIRNPQPSP
eukprot:comp15416_c0_seq1/m.23430 comp15416_c0_seq1/g.23430  ORF comp15416_c0_seq1/g.23430 comp15416_c0_seq1/m.23430 type:complete len:312 (-) comp15416_c0_seq1:52-987(-)